MPFSIDDIPEHYENTTRIIVKSIVEDLITHLNIKEPVKLFNKGTTEASPQVGSAIGQDTSLPLTSFNNEINITTEEILEDEAALTTAISRKEHRCIFLDESTRIYIKPVYTRATIELSLTFQGSSKTIVQGWRNKIRRKSTQIHPMMPLHEVSYHYPIPRNTLELLKVFHEMKERVAGYNETFEQWLERSFSKQMSPIVTLDGKKGDLAISEKQIQILGLFNFDVQPEPEMKNNEGETWSITFTYTFSYDKILSIVMYYPISIHNQLVPIELMDTQRPYDVYEHPMKPSITGLSMAYFSRANEPMGKVNPCIQIPYFDDWKIPNPHGLLKPIFISLIGADLDRPHWIASIGDLDTIVFHPLIKDYLIRSKDRIFRYLDHPLHFSFYCNEALQNEQRLSIEDNGDLYYQDPLNLRKVYHLVFSIVWDLKLLSERAKKELRENPELCIRIVDMIEALKRTRSPRLDPYDTYAERPFPNENYFSSPKVSRSHSGAEETFYHKDPPFGDNPYRGGHVKGHKRTTYHPHKAPRKISDELQILGGKYITEQSFEVVCGYLNPHRSLPEIGGGKGPRTVMNTLLFLRS